MAVKTKSVQALFDSMNRAFPNRDKASDGWIGDEAHRHSSSGHNPDESGNAEFDDADNIDEVRAADLDEDLRDPRVSMHDILRAILATPADRNRCAYLIYERKIYSRSTAFEPRTYFGSNPHDKHLHVSTLPSADDDGRPWQSIERLGAFVMATKDELREVIAEFIKPVDDEVQRWRIHSLAHGTDIGGGPQAGRQMWLVQALNGLAAAVANVDEELAARLVPLLVPAIVGAVTESLGQVDADALTAAVETGVRNVLGSLDGA